MFIIFYRAPLIHRKKVISIENYMTKIHYKHHSFNFFFFQLKHILLALLFFNLKHLTFSFISFFFVTQFCTKKKAKIIFFALLCSVLLVVITVSQWFNVVLKYTEDLNDTVSNISVLSWWTTVYGTIQTCYDTSISISFLTVYMWKSKTSDYQIFRRRFAMLILGLSENKKTTNALGK